MKILSLLAVTLVGMAPLSFAQSLQINDSYAGPLYRALVGETVSVSANGTKTVANDQEVLMTCAPNGKPKKDFNNAYHCAINFETLKGQTANAVYRAIAGANVTLKVENAASEFCAEDHCVKILELTCISPVECSVSSYHSGWNE